MILYIHSLVDVTQAVFAHAIATEPGLPYPDSFPIQASSDVYSVKEVEFDNIEALKAAWNPGTFQDRQAIVDALPKIQSISIAGTIQ